jgi:hypothetical protein
MADFEIRVEGTRGPEWREDFVLSDRADARAEAALLLSQLIKDGATQISDPAPLKVTVTDKASGWWFSLQLSAHCGGAVS